MNLSEKVPELRITHGYFTDAYFRNRRAAGQPVPHPAAAPVRTDSRPVIDWRTGLRYNEAEMAEQFCADLPAGETK